MGWVELHQPKGVSADICSEMAKCLPTNLGRPVSIVTRGLEGEPWDSPVIHWTAAPHTVQPPLAVPAIHLLPGCCNKHICCGRMLLYTGKICHSYWFNKKLIDQYTTRLGKFWEERQVLTSQTQRKQDENILIVKRYQTTWLNTDKNYTLIYKS